MADFASGMARDLEQPLRSLEHFADAMRAMTESAQLTAALPLIHAAGRAVRDMALSTQRYGLIAAGPRVEDDHPIGVEELIHFVLVFHSRQNPSNSSLAPRSDLDPAHTLPHALGRLIILVLVSTLKRIEGPWQGRLQALTFEDQPTDRIFHMVFFTPKARHLHHEFQELLAAFRSTLLSLHGSFRLEFPDHSHEPARLMLRVPKDL